MSVNMMKLGGYTFSVDTAAYQNMDRTTSWRWQSQERIGTTPAYQFVGNGDDSITLKGVIYTHYNGGIGQLKAMRQEASNGSPLLLVSGQGDIQGKWLIKQIQETQTVFESNGLPRKVEFSMELARYAI